jgi:hypothetical protein
MPPGLREAAGDCGRRQERMVGRQVVDGGQFEAVVRAMATGRSRRAALGAALGGLFASGSFALLGEDAGARKKGKGKKKKKCKGCTECQTCQKGTCKPKPAGAACATGICQEGEICTCSLAPDNCPSGCDCRFLSAGEVTICTQSDGISEGPLCETDAECVRGEMCVVAEYDPTTHAPVFRCGAVCDA